MNNLHVFIKEVFKKLEVYPYYRLCPPDDKIKELVETNKLVFVEHEGGSHWIKKYQLVDIFLFEEKWYLPQDYCSESLLLL
ncbi:MAG: hypothetical protein R3B41_02740 [Candidatus Doudnabacteria bacterium]